MRAAEELCRDGPSEMFSPKLLVWLYATRIA